MEKANRELNNILCSADPSTFSRSACRFSRQLSHRFIHRCLSSQLDAMVYGVLVKSPLHSLEYSGSADVGMECMFASKRCSPFVSGYVRRNSYVNLMERWCCAKAKGMVSRYELQCYGSKTHLGCLDRGLRSCRVAGCCITDEAMRILFRSHLAIGAGDPGQAA
jgi:hypothetical protein